jgi:hypothetical protein
VTRTPFGVNVEGLRKTREFVGVDRVDIISRVPEYLIRYVGYQLQSTKPYSAISILILNMGGGYVYKGAVDHTVEPDRTQCKGKSVIVTGGAQGIGEIYVRGFVDAG